MRLMQLAKLCWQDRSRGAPWVENCLNRMAAMPGRAGVIGRRGRSDPASAVAECLDLVRRGDWEYEVHDDIYGSLWFVNGPSSGLTIIPGCKAYRLSTSTNDWAMFENTWGHAVRFKGGEAKLAEGAIGFADLDPVPPSSVPGDVYVMAMLYNLAKELEHADKTT